MENHSIEILKKFFTISNAAFEFKNIVLKTFSNKEPTYTLMEKLHTLMLRELNEEAPNVLVIESLLAQMEELANKNE